MPRVTDASDSHAVCFAAVHFVYGRPHILALSIMADASENGTACSRSNICMTNDTVSRPRTLNKSLQNGELLCLTYLIRKGMTNNFQQAMILFSYFPRICDIESNI